MKRLQTSHLEAAHTRARQVAAGAPHAPCSPASVFDIHKGPVHRLIDLRRPEGAVQVDPLVCVEVQQPTGTFARGVAHAQAEQTGAGIRDARQP